MTLIEARDLHQQHMLERRSGPDTLTLADFDEFRVLGSGEWPGPYERRIRTAEDKRLVDRVPRRLERRGQLHGELLSVPTGQRTTEWLTKWRS